MKVKITIILLILLSLSILPSQGEISVNNLKDISSSASLTEIRKDRNGETCAELRILNALPDIVVKGNVIGDINVIPGYTSVFLTGGTKIIVINTFSDGQLEISFPKFGIPELLPGAVYQLELSKSEDPVFDRLAEAQMLHEAGLSQRVLNMYEGVTDITGEEYVLLAECEFDVVYHSSQTPKDYSKQEYYIKKGAELGAPGALNVMGYKYLNGFDPYPQDIPLAIKYYSESAEKGNSDAIFQLVMIFTDEDWAGVDSKNARYWINKAFENPADFDYDFLGDFYGRLGYVYENEGNLNEAINNYNKAIEMGADDSVPYYRLGRLYAEGKGVNKDLGKAFELLQRGIYLNDEARNYFENFKKTNNF